MSPNPKSNSARRPEPTEQQKILRIRSSSSNLYREEERLKTFREWPSTYIAPEELAADGFYYVGQSDIVRCSFCGVEVGQWVEGDNVRQDHQRWAPDCDMVCGRPCGNVPLSESTPETSPSGSPPSYDTCGPFRNIIRPYSGPERAPCAGGLPGAILDGLEQLGVSRASRPVKPKYISEESRLRTYVGWPSSCPVTPEALAAAGFYYTGVDDNAICFLCGGGLKDWEVGDDPWVEHARWFSRCAFILMQKGRDFVVKVSNEKPPMLPCETVKQLLEQQAPLPAEDSPSENVPMQEATADELPTPKAPEPCTVPSEGESGETQDIELCQICYTRPRGIVFLPCGHFVSCAMCAFALTSCPICRKPFEATVRAHWS